MFYILADFADTIVISVLRTYVTWHVFTGFSTHGTCNTIFTCLDQFLSTKLIRAIVIANFEWSISELAKDKMYL